MDLAYFNETNGGFSTAVGDELLKTINTILKRNNVNHLINFPSSWENSVFTVTNGHKEHHNAIVERIVLPQDEWGTHYGTPQKRIPPAVGIRWNGLHLLGEKYD